ncbi:MAG: 2-dehydro-3-deoxygalactonokinase [Rhizomicrobium sp.]
MSPPLEGASIALLGIDWGSSSLRAFAIAPDGGVVAARRADDGVFAGAGAFDERLRRHLGDWLVRWPAAPILLCGMIGSDRGWRQAPYAAAPAGLADLAAALVPLAFERPAHIVPGVSFRAGETREVMRGEETLLMGLVGQAGEATICLPGTHSKWVDVRDGRIAAFRTYMTGELRAQFLAQGTLAPGVAQVASGEAFAAGLSAAGAGVTAALFQARARRLLGELAPEHTASFITGVLIGEEVAREAKAGAPVILAAGGAMAQAYGNAFSAAGIACTVADPEPLAARGLLRIARQAGCV